jgi:hypothetical protein
MHCFFTSEPEKKKSESRSMKVVELLRDRDKNADRDIAGMVNDYVVSMQSHGYAVVNNILYPIVKDGINISGWRQVIMLK